MLDRGEVEDRVLEVVGQQAELLAVSKRAPRFPVSEAKNARQDRQYMSAVRSSNMADHTCR